MSRHDAATLARRWFEEVWNERRDEAIDELMSPDAVGHMAGGDVIGPRGFREVYAEFLKALPDMHIVVEDILADEHRAVVRWRVRATHTGELLGVAPTGRKVDFRGMSWITVRDGHLYEGWDGWNLGGLLESLRQ
jgi:steroid delta-isomerase-like uncharacterized protein